MPPDAAAEIVERPVEPVTLIGDELQEAVPFGLELTDLSLELVRVPASRLRLPRELRREVRERVTVLLELGDRCGQLRLELGDPARLARQRGGRGAAAGRGELSARAATTDVSSMRPATIATAPTNAARQMPAA